MPQSPKIIVVGGRSAIGTALQHLYLPDATYVVRQEARSGERKVRDYRDLSADDLAGFDALINCAGAVAGGRDELICANVDLPAALADSARAAGITTFVHVSSFSVYGLAELITDETPVRPITDYGRSKLAGDEAVLERADEHFRPTIVRFPAIIDALRERGKVARLIAAWLRIRFMPVPARPVSRSMISTSLAAQVLANVVGSRARPLVLAADAQPFIYATVAQALSNRLGVKLRVLPLPDFVFAPLRRSSLGTFQSLFGNSLLESASNFAAGLPSDLHATLAELATTMARK